MRSLKYHELDREYARSILAVNLPWSPLDFIREISKSGDRLLYAEQLTAIPNLDDDLCFVSKDKHDLIGVFARKLPWDSEFFGYGVARLDGIFPLSEPYYQPYADYTRLAQELMARARLKDIRYLFAHVDTRDIATIRALGQVGFSVIDTRVLYHMSLKGYKPQERYSVRFATVDDISCLQRVAAEEVNLYDRFHSDPFIKKEDADRLMYKWVEASIAENFADIVLVPAVSNPGAFMTVKNHTYNWETWGLKVVQFVVTAISREFKGWYQKLFSEVHCYLQQIGAEHSYISTQTANKAVIWVFEKFGYGFGRGELVLRIIL
jgi:dTDP-4-amino-4,6-dideoxy-D-galactose acyltransferase